MFFFPPEPPKFTVHSARRGKVRYKTSALFIVSFPSKSATLISRPGEATAHFHPNHKKSPSKTKLLNQITAKTFATRITYQEIISHVSFLMFPKHSQRHYKSLNSAYFFNILLPVRSKNPFRIYCVPHFSCKGTLLHFPQSLQPGPFSPLLSFQHWFRLS